MVSDEPADPRLLAQLIEIPAARVDELCVELAAEYDAQQRGFALRRWPAVGGSRAVPSCRRMSSALCSPASRRFIGRCARNAVDRRAGQPISRAQVAAIRGVSVDGVMRTLQQRGYIGELARDPGPARRCCSRTTSLFLERLGLNSSDELPPLGDFVPGPDVVEALEAGLRVNEDSAHDAPAQSAAHEAAAHEAAAHEAAAPQADELGDRPPRSGGGQRGAALARRP